MEVLGRSFGRLMVLSEASDRKGYWLCQCQCGNTKLVSYQHLRSGKTKSCGCLRVEKTVERNTSHNMSGSRTYSVWASMISRCYCPGSTSFKRYGAVGVMVCDRWKTSFENFLEDMGEVPDGMSLERLNGAKLYSPESCVWATPKEQALSRKSTRWFTYGGKTMCLKDWATHLGVPYLKLYKRVVYRGWSFEKAISDTIKY